MVIYLIPLLLAASTSVTAPEPRTAQAVVSADRAWLTAELAGDTRYLDQLLLPEYRSVSSDGRSTSKGTIIAHARANAGSTAMAKKVAAWQASHPLRDDVSIFGDTAVLRWILVDSAKGDPVSSSDIFVYRKGHWRAIYSQHSSADN